MGPATRLAFLISGLAVAAAAWSQSEAHCPLCVAGGFGADEAGSSKTKWLANTVWAQGTETEAESFLWYRVDPRLQLGMGYLWRQRAVRALGTYVLSPETATMPMLNVGFGVQGIGTGNPGYFATVEKTFRLRIGPVNAYVGGGFRTNENHGHMLGGLKFTPTSSQFTFGIQLDGHNAHLFLTRSFDRWSLGAYLIDLKAPGAMVSYRF